MNEAQEKILRPRQENAIASIRRSLGRGHKRPMLQFPTGAGKTLVACRIIKMAVNKGSRVMFVAPAISLIQQTVDAFIADGISEDDISVIHRDDPRCDYSKPVHVCSLQTIARRPSLPEAHLVIVDEAHRWFKSMGTWMQDWDAVPFIGLSATPWTKGLGKYYDDLIVGGTTQDMIDEGHLSPFEVFGPSSPDLSKVKIVAGDYHEGQLSEVMSSKKLVADVVKSWQQLGNNEATLCYGVDRAHANMMMENFNAAGIPCEYMDAYTELDERQDIERRFHNGDIKIVCNVGVLTTGIDWNVRTLILARPTRSRILFTQIIGRALRTASGKNIARILDHSSTHENLGLVTDIHITGLDDGKSRSNNKKDKEPELKLPKKCPSCHFLKPVGVHACPSCGFAPTKRSQIKNERGELVRLNGKSIDSPEKRNKKETNDQKDRMWTDFKAIARARGYSAGWMAHTYKKYYGVWPRNRKNSPGEISPLAQAFVAAELKKYRSKK